MKRRFDEFNGINKGVNRLAHQVADSTWLIDLHIDAIHTLILHICSDVSEIWENESIFAHTKKRTIDFINGVSSTKFA